MEMHRVRPTDLFVLKSSIPPLVLFLFLFLLRSTVCLFLSFRSRALARAAFVRRTKPRAFRSFRTRDAMRFRRLHPFRHLPMPTSHEGVENNNKSTKKTTSLKERGGDVENASDKGRAIFALLATTTTTTTTTRKTKTTSH